MRGSALIDDARGAVNAAAPRAILGLLRALAWPLAAALLAAWHFASFPWRDHPLATDVRHFLYFAQQTAAGALPHADFFDNKTALATFLGAGLYRLGDAMGVEPLHAVRLGYLALATLAATLAFVVHRTIGGGRVACGAFALAFHCGFWLLGLLPSIGNVPKLGMATFATAAALCAHHRAWTAAGVLSGLSALDWQVGALAALGVLAAAGLRPSRERPAALARVVLGGALAALPVLALYGARGALGPLFRQTVAASLSRGAATQSLAFARDEWARRWQVVSSGTEGHTGLLLIAALGVPAYWLWLRSPRGRAMRGLASVLGVYHLGVLAFSSWDFQVYGDLFALLHTACFFAALAAGEAYLTLAAHVPGSRGKTMSPLLAALACLVWSRPWVDRGTLRVPGIAGTEVTLAAQREVAARLAPLLARSTTAVRGASEQLFLTHTRNPLPFVVWNPAVYTYFRRGPDEERTETLARLMDEAGIERLVCVRDSPRCGGLVAWERVHTVGHTPGYAVDVYERRGPGGPTPRNPGP
jgi:hypothetical protein